MEDNDIMFLEAGIKTASMISPSGNVSRLEVIFSENPGSSETLGKIGLLRKALIPHHGGTVKEILVGGDMAIQYDTKVAINRDMLVISPVVLAVILVVLIILVKAIIAPIYLLLSVVLTFFASLGISVLIFQNVLGHEGIGGNVPIFMFIFLVALGIDYNIYIISRVREEAKTRDTKYGTIVALSQTGGVITSAGIILAGTFTAMATLPLTFLFQLGFVVAFGVLLDTFFIRGIVVPAFVILFGRWNWWPSMPKLPRSGESPLEN
jgi:RND superfamily putative drug exporter